MTGRTGGGGTPGGGGRGRPGRPVPREHGVPPQPPQIRVTEKRRHLSDDPAAAQAGSPDEGSDPASDAARTGSEEIAPEVAEARAQAAEYLGHLQRLQAEFENYRKRVLKEQTRAIEVASEGVVRRLLEVLDDFQLALAAAEAQPDFERFRRGVELVYEKLADILRAEGLEPIDATGKPFDPELHEALFQSEGGEGDPYVAEVLRPGYALKGRVLRPAGVRVARPEAGEGSDPENRQEPDAEREPEAERGSERQAESDAT